MVGDDDDFTPSATGTDNAANPSTFIVAAEPAQHFCEHFLGLQVSSKM